MRLINTCVSILETFFSYSFVNFLFAGGERRKEPRKQRDGRQTMMLILFSWKQNATGTPLFARPVSGSRTNAARRRNEVVKAEPIDNGTTNPVGGSSAERCQHTRALARAKPTFFRLVADSRRVGIAG